MDVFRTYGMALLLIGGLALGLGIGASDHVDELDLILHEAADLTGLLAFTSPERPGHLVLIMDVHPFAKEGSKFAEDVVYNFRLREVDSVGAGGMIDVALRATEEHRISCRFAGDPQVATCTAGSEIETQVTVDDTSGGPSEDLRVFAGLRSDPFFMDIPGYLATIALQGAVDHLPEELRKHFDDSPADAPPGVFRFSGKNTGQNTNVLSLVAEVNVENVFGPEAGPIFAVSSETLRADS